MVSNWTARLWTCIGCSQEGQIEKGSHMNRGYKVIDCNRHVVEPLDLWEQWIEVDPGRGTVSLLGRVVYEPRTNVFTDPDYRAVFTRACDQSFSPESNLADMDAQGIDTAVLLPTLGMYVAWADFIDAPLATAVCRAYNNWLHHYCSAQPARL